MILKHINDLASVCAGHNIETAVISPGSRSAPLTLAFNEHPGIEVKVIGDERSAAFIALGIAQQQKKPVALICTSGSAILNYAPAIAEAYYQEIPLIILSADRPPEWVNQYDGQTIRQSSVLGSHVKASYDYPVEAEHSDAFWHANRIANEAILKALSFPKGPVHINIPLREPFYPAKDESLEFSETRIIKSSDTEVQLTPALQEELRLEWSRHENKAIVIGHTQMDPKQFVAISDFCQRTNTVLINEVIGNHHLAPRAIQKQDAFLQPSMQPSLSEISPGLLITVGKSLISKNLKIFLRKNPPRAHWHIRNSDRINDTLQHLTRWVDMKPESFFNTFEPSGNQKGFLEKWVAINEKANKTTEQFLSSCPFGEFQAIHRCLKALPSNSQLHLANSMTVRYANLIGLSSDIEVFSNRGTSGIDGSNGTAVGSALAQDKLVTLITGDMAFFYDRNAFWHNYDLAKLRIIILNNHGGGIFRMIKGPQGQKDYQKLFETDQALTAENTAKDHGFIYQACSDLNGLDQAMKDFFDTSDKPKIFEVFSDSKKNTEIFSAFKQHFEA